LGIIGGLGEDRSRDPYMVLVVGYGTAGIRRKSAAESRQGSKKGLILNEKILKLRGKVGKDRNIWGGGILITPTGEELIKLSPIIISWVFHMGQKMPVGGENSA